jgi:hypothetical protein
MELPNDVYYHILLYSDIDTINNLCTSSKHGIPICNDVNFWLDKFDYANIPIWLPYKHFVAKDWIHLYKSYDKAVDTVEYILSHTNNKYIFEVNMDDDIVSLLPVKIVTRFDNTLYVTVGTTRTGTTLYVLYGTHHFVISKENLIKLITKIYFLYPHVIYTVKPNIKRQFSSMGWA